MKRISDWSFEAKYDLLGVDEKMLHNAVLQRADLHDLIYVIIASVSFVSGLVLSENYLVWKYVFVFFSFAVVGWALYKHFSIRAKLKDKFEHQSQFRKENRG